MGFQPIRSAGCRCHVRRYEDFDRLELHRCSFQNSDIFQARQFAVRWSINAARICRRAIGGMTDRGSAPSGICSCRLEDWLLLMEVSEVGSWMDSVPETVISSAA